MKFQVKLYNANTKAADGSAIPKDIMQEFLNSDRFKKDLESHRILGGLTHASRETSLKCVGPDDGVLIDNNTCYYVTAVYFVGDDCYADAETLNPDDFSGEHRDKINTVIGFLKSGVLLPVSMVIECRWSVREVATHVDRLLGFDITIDPSFKGAEVIKVFSKQNSNIRIFSKESEVRCYDEIATNEYFNVNIPVCLLEDDEFMKKAKEIPQDKLKAFTESYLKKKYYTYDVNLIDRMIIVNKPIFNQFYLLVKGYSLYYRSHRSSVLSDPSKFERMLMADLSNILLKGLSRISVGKNPAAPLGMKGYSDEIEEAVDEFTKVHFRNALVFKSAGFLPKNRFSEERDALLRLYNAVLAYITSGYIQLTKNDNIIFI